MTKYSAQYEWNKRNPEKTKLAYRRCMLKRRYGITLEEYEQMFADLQSAITYLKESSWLYGRNKL